MALRRSRSRSTEQRDPRVATATHRFTAGLRVGTVGDLTADDAFRLGVEANVIAYRCVRLRSRAAGRVPLVAGRKLGDMRTVRDGAPIMSVLGPAPGVAAPGLTASKLFTWSHAQRIVTGRVAWEIDRGPRGARPVALWPIVASEIEPVPADGGPRWWDSFLAGPAGQQVRLSPDQVFYAWDPSGRDFRQPASEMQAARYDLSLVQLADRYGVSFLRNNAVPAAIITTAEFPDDAAREAFVSTWRGEFGGVDNAGRVSVTEVSADGTGPVSDLVDVKVLGVSPQQAALRDHKQDALHQVAIALATPWSMLDASGRTFDNAEMEERTWWETTILPDLDELRDEINLQLAPMFGDEVVWWDLRDVRALRRRLWPVGGGDRVALLDRGVVTPNEVRGDIDMEPIAGGDIPIVRPDPVAAPAQTVPVADATETDGRTVEPETRDAKDAPDLAPEPEPSWAEQRAEYRAQMWRATDATVTRIEHDWETALARFFARQADATVDRALGKRGRQSVREGVPDPDRIFDRVFWDENLGDLLAQLFGGIVPVALSAVSVVIGFGPEFIPDAVDTWLKARAREVSSQVNQTTLDAIRQAMSDGVTEGEAIDQIADRIRQVFTVASESRARTIARTEVIGAHNRVTAELGDAYPPDVVAGREWIATADARTRPDHLDADGQIVLRGGLFTVGGEQMVAPGQGTIAANNINCRCTVGLLTPTALVEWQKAHPEQTPAGPLAPVVQLDTARAALILAHHGTPTPVIRRFLEATYA